MGSKRDPRDISSYNRYRHNAHCGLYQGYKEELYQLQDHPCPTQNQDRCSMTYGGIRLQRDWYPPATPDFP
jgi:hypothetical protein